MQILERQSISAGASWYSLTGEHQGQVERYVVSTPASREICNRSELLGVDFTVALHDAVAGALSEAPFRDLLTGHPEERVCVVHFLRGGLNFEIRRALHTAFGSNRHSSAFMSSQRERVDGRWRVKEDMYRKLEIPRDALLVVGDVVATGVTLANGFQVIVDHLAVLGSSLKGLVLLTIGCHKAEKVLEELDAQLRERFSGYERTILVYLEGKFRLVDSRTGLRIGIPGTDLVRLDTILSPELERSQYESLAHPLERCAIYDAGSRAFDIPGYVRDVVGYWEAMSGFAKRGWTLGEALRERWPERDYIDRDRFSAAKRAVWRGVDDGFLDELYAAYETRRSGESGRRLATPEALRALCRERVATLRAVAGEETAE